MDEFLIGLQQPLFRYLLRLTGDAETAAELTQESMLRGWANQKRMHEAASPRAWMFRVAHNTWIDLLHQQRTTTHHASICNMEIASNSPGPDAIASSRELGQRVWEAIDQLPNRQRQVMHLRMIEQLQIYEISDVLKIDQAAVRSSLSVARKRLRAEFQCQFNERE